VPESLIDALQGIFPTVGRKPIERGGSKRVAVRDWRDEREGRDDRVFEVKSSRFLELRTQNFEFRNVPISRLFWRCFLTRFSWVLEGVCKRNLTEDGIAIPGHKPIQQIAEWLN